MFCICNTMYLFTSKSCYSFHRICFHIACLDCPRWSEKHSQVTFWPTRFSIHWNFSCSDRLIMISLSRVNCCQISILNLSLVLKIPQFTEDTGALHSSFCQQCYRNSRLHCRSLHLQSYFDLFWARQRQCLCCCGDYLTTAEADKVWFNLHWIFKEHNVNLQISVLGTIYETTRCIAFIATLSLSLCNVCRPHHWIFLSPHLIHASTHNSKRRIKEASPELICSATMHGSSSKIDLSKPATVLVIAFVAIASSDCEKVREIFERKPSSNMKYTNQKELQGISCSTRQSK